jgi:hypothetical protein
MDSGWLLADGEAVASAQRVRSVRDRHRGARAARRGELAVVMRAPTIVLGPLDVIRVRSGLARSVRCAPRRPVCVLRPGLVVLVGHGDAAAAGLRPGSNVELRWAT